MTFFLTNAKNSVSLLKLRKGAKMLRIKNLASLAIIFGLVSSSSVQAQIQGRCLDSNSSNMFLEGIFRDQDVQAVFCEKVTPNTDVCLTYAKVSGENVIVTFKRIVLKLGDTASVFICDVNTIKISRENLIFERKFGTPS